MNGALLPNLVLFGRVLRRLGLDVHPGRIVDLVAALEVVSIRNRSDFQAAARSLLVHRREDLARFDAAFDAFFTRRDPLARPHARVIGELPRATIGPLPDSLKPAAPQDPELATYSDRELLRTKDFAEMTPDELRAVRALMAQIVWRVNERRTRRLRPGRGRLLDLRRTVRRNLRYGGEVLDWARREPKHKPRPLVILADVSGSMERYSRLLLLFTYGLARALEQKVEAFVFSTRLTRITRQLQQRTIDAALAEVSRTVPDWSGGTRIGDALHAFNFRWGRRVLGRGALALVISDGWDRGDPAQLAAETARLQHNCHRLIWLNPLLGAPDYQPLTRGIQAALPFIDDFLPVHNLNSLAALAEHLWATTARRRM
ncbi:MAG TPA: VWA domain-containing protein [Thermoanaerobaculia bacterium]|nr:VWA domain-containing protein [Thermoanaerobaculia bacterium]